MLASPAPGCVDVSGPVRTTLIMNSKPSLAILAFSPIRRDARVLRQIIYLASRFSVVVLGYGEVDSLPPGVAYYAIQEPSGIGLERKLRTSLYLPLGRLFPAWAYEAWYWQRSDRQAMFERLNELSPHLIHANDWDTLPIAIKIAQKTGARVLLDLHEYSPRQFENRIYRRTIFNPMIDYFLKRYGSMADVVITVNQVIAERYAREYQFHPSIVMNAPSLDTTPSFNITDAQHIRLIHHGAASRDRKLEMMIHTLAQTDSRYSLTFMLVGEDQAYIKALKLLSEEIAPGRVVFQPPVPPTQIVSHIKQFDLGFFLLPPTSFSYYAALPNKFFDFVMAGLAVCIGPSLEMARLVDQYKFGAVAASFEPGDAAQLLNSLTAKDIDQMKHNALEARKVLNAEVEMSKLVDLYASLV